MLKKAIKYRQGNDGDLRVMTCLQNKYRGPLKVTFFILK